MTTLRLSEAIRLGSMLRPQARGGFELVRVRGWRGWLLRETELGSCALAAAAEAVGRTHWGDVATVWPWTLRDTAHPAERGRCRAAAYVAYDLNDNYGWSRERIADWIASLEQQQEQPQPLRVTELAEVV